jgi:hypothetical protein
MIGYYYHGSSGNRMGVVDWIIKAQNEDKWQASNMATNIQVP